MSASTAPRSLPRPLTTGDRVGRFRIVGELGRGGMGVVYRAEDERLGRSVALKFLPAHLRSDAVARDRLLVEARAVAALDHPNVCTVYEVAADDSGRDYIAFACYEGTTLQDRLRDGPLAIDEAVRIAREVASGLAAAHARGIIHRDLKPSNVFLCEDGTAKILDFGIAKMDGVALTATGQTPGTVEYGAPETLRGEVSARSDLWSLGVVLYEMLTGRRPFEAPYEAAVLYSILHEAPAAASSLNPEVTPDLDAVVARCLAKESDDRFDNASGLSDALARTDETQGRDQSSDIRASRSKWIEGATMSLLALTVGLLTIWAGLTGFDTDTQADQFYTEGMAFLERDHEVADLKRAIGMFEQSIQASPEFGRAQARLAESSLLLYAVTLDTMAIHDADVASARALELAPDDYLSHVARSAYYRMVGDSRLSMQEARRAVNLDGGSPEALVEFARAQELGGDNDGARATFQRAVEADPDRWTTQAEMGDFYSRTGDYARSADAFRAVTARAPASRRGHLGLGSALQHLGDEEGAIEAYERVNRIEPHADAFSNMAVIQLSRENYSAAVDLYRRSLAVDSTSHYTWSGLASALESSPGHEDEQRGALRSAARAANRILSVNPNHARSRAGLALYQEALGRDREALESARESIALGSGDALVHFQAGIALELLGERDEALVQLTEAERLGYPVRPYVDSDPSMEFVKQSMYFQD